jgi:hypothetical protein
MAKKTIALVAALALAASAAACGGRGGGEESKGLAGTILQGDIKTGSWSEDGSTFVNEWSNIKFAMPESMTRLSDEEFQQLSDEAASNTSERPGLTKEKVEVVRQRSAFDFYFTTSTRTLVVMGMYENLEFASRAYSSAEDYFNISKDKYLGFSDLGVEYLGPQTATIAGEEYFKGTLSMLDGALYLDYYIRIVDKIAMTISVSYRDDATKAAGDDFIGSITAAN